jgi:PAS domain-containing protein/HPt (histidine-containing phosphotransfer) domain-containing protein
MGIVSATVGAVPLQQLESLKRLCDDLIDGVYVVDLEYRLLYANPALRRMMRLRPKSTERCSDQLKLDICQTSCILGACQRNKARAMWSETITHAARDGDLAVQVGASALLDEAGAVAGAIGFIRDVSVEVSLHTKYREQLERERRANEILEQTVQERTRELRAANREVRDILDNIQQGIFTVSPSLVVNPEHSRQVTWLFRDMKIAGASAAELLFPRPQDTEARQKLEDWLRLVFTQPHLPWDVLGQLVDREISYHPVGGGNPQAFVLDYVPIREDANVVKVMVLVEDVTEKRALLAEVERREREREADLAQIAEIIELDPEIFEQFLTEAEQLVTSAREHAASLAGLSYLEQRSVIDVVFRQVHTLKGNARSFKLSLISQRAHLAEGVLAELRDGKRSLDAELAQEIDRAMIELEEMVVRAGQLRDRVLKRTREPDRGHVRKEHRDPALPIKASRLLQIRTLSTKIADQLGTGGPVDSEDIQNLLLRVSSLTHVSFAKLLTRLRRMVSDLAISLGKQVDLIEEGTGDLEIQIEVLNILGDGLIHVLRNSIDHGIESPQERSAKGKNPTAKLNLRVQRKAGDWMIVEVTDDGGGIDTARVVKQAVLKGLIDEKRAATLSEGEAVDLIFLPGFSTREVVTDVSGRGVGMDAVRASAKALGGTVHVESQLGIGCKIVFKIPENVVVYGPPMKNG